MPNIETEFDKLCTLEMRLRKLHEHPRRTPASCRYAHFDKTDSWRLGMVEELESLVGNFAEKRHPALATSAAYDGAHQKIHNALRQQ